MVFVVVFDNCTSHEEEMHWFCTPGVQEAEVVSHESKSTLILP